MAHQGEPSDRKPSSQREEWRKCFAGTLLAMILVPYLTIAKRKAHKQSGSDGDARHNARVAPEPPPALLDPSCNKLPGALRLPHYEHLSRRLTQSITTRSAP
jgi:hypothetical protein